MTEVVVTVAVRCGRIAVVVVVFVVAEVFAIVVESVRVVVVAEVVLER
jgi:hypothetical protein